MLHVTLFSPYVSTRATSIFQSRSTCFVTRWSFLKEKIICEYLEYEVRRGGVDRGSGLDCGSDDPGSIPVFPSPCVGPLMATWQGGYRRLLTSCGPCRGTLGTLQTPSCPWSWVPCSRSKFGNSTTVPSPYSWNIAACDVKPQPIKPTKSWAWNFYISVTMMILNVIFSVPSLC